MGVERKTLERVTVRHIERAVIAKIWRVIRNSFTFAGDSFPQAAAQPTG
jgi:hypothetical protein